MMQAIIGEWSVRHDVIDSDLTAMRMPGQRPVADDP